MSGYVPSFGAGLGWFQSPQEREVSLRTDVDVVQ